MGKVSSLYRAKPELASNLGPLSLQLEKLKAGGNGNPNPLSVLPP